MQQLQSEPASSDGQPRTVAPSTDCLNKLATPTPVILGLIVHFRRNERFKNDLVSRIRVRTPLELYHLNVSNLENVSDNSTIYVKPEKNISYTTEENVDLGIDEIQVKFSDISVPSKTQRRNSSNNIKETVRSGISKSTNKSLNRNKVSQSTVKTNMPKLSENNFGGKTPSALYKKLKSGYFYCNICREKFTHRYKVHLHIKKRHEPAKTYKCNDCDKSYKSKFLMTQHTRQEHRENGSDYLFYCDKCDYQSKSKYYLKFHLIRKHTEECNYTCAHCGKGFKMKMDLKSHIGTHRDHELMCHTCGNMYTTSDALNKHVRVYHLNNYKFQCNICHQKLLTQKNLDKHKRLHDSSRYKCDECGLKFAKKYYVTRHKKRMHELERNNICKLCSKTFMCKASLRIHYLTHTKAKPYLCNVCGSRFTQRSSMMIHWKRKHPDAEEPPPPVILTNFFDSVESEVNRLVEIRSRKRNNQSSSVEES